MGIEEAFGVVLRKYRKSNKLSQEELALHCDLDRTYISLLERGERNPSLKTVFALSKHLEANPSEIVRETEQIYSTDNSI